MKNLVIIFLLASFLPHEALARRRSRGGGMSFQVSTSLPGITIENPDGTTAGYSGNGAMGKLIMPLFSADSFTTNFHLGYKMNRIENAYSNEATEAGSHIGPALGLTLDWYKLFLVLEYSKIDATHHLSGKYGRTQEFEYSMMTYAIGFQSNFEKLKAGISYHMGSGDISASSTGFQSDSAIAEKTIMIHVNFPISTSLSDIGDAVVSK